MKPKALPLVAFVLLAAAAVVNAQTPPAPPVPEAPAAPVVAPAPPPAPAPDVLEAIAAAPDAPEAPLAPAAVLADDVLEPAVAPAPPQEPAPAPAPAPAPPALAQTFFVSGSFLGVRTEDVTRENMQRYGLSGEPRGVGVREVVKGSPAEKAGLRANDVIIRFDGEAVTSVRKLTRLVEESAPDHVARITVARGGSEQELSATLTRREPLSVGELGPVNVYGTRGPWPLGGALAGPPEQWERNSDELRKQFDELGRAHPGLLAFGTGRRIGVTTNALGKQLADYFGVAHGVLVSSVEEGSPAEKAGLKAGDIVTEADGQKVEDSDDLTRALSAKEEGEVTLTVVRDRKSRTVRVTPERRAAPQGMFAPGTFRVLESPVAAFTLPGEGIQMRPDVPSLPRTLVTPRLLTAPRIRATPRARVFGLGDGVL